ncbi:MAG: ABC transporter ATP-binding protein [Candidatus Hodarchaeales archaeon]|jgi:oligopeptide/dipeptide ABC transporter ATP-binding protein
MSSQDDNLLELKNIKKYFPVEKNIFERIIGGSSNVVHAVDDITLNIKENEIFGLCGESGCGKSTTARVISGLDFETSGEFVWNGSTKSIKERKPLSFRKNIQLIFQNPFQSLHPRMNVGSQVAHALVIQGQKKPEKKAYDNKFLLSRVLIAPLVIMLIYCLFFIIQYLFAQNLKNEIITHVFSIGNVAVVFPGSFYLFPTIALFLLIIFVYYKLYPRDPFLDQEVIDLFTSVGLNPAPDYYVKYPHELSGGERQRVAIARALILNPKLIVADEPTSMLDVSIRASILDLMSDLKKRFNLSVLFITHDLATVRYFCDKVAIMYVGEIVEFGTIKEVYDNPRHPYTWSLLQAIPVPDPSYERLSDLPSGEVPDAINPPSGCRFHPRCPHVKEICMKESPKLQKLSSNHSVSCHLQEELFFDGKLKID